ncbi:MAG: GMC family oxidoreductase, partial [Alphaproteobacteria bacterium]
DNPRVVRARREVIVSGGTVNTARLLQLSGIGRAAFLQSLGIPVVRDLPGVGENFRDHYAVRLVARVRDITTINELARGPRLGGEIAKWMLGRPSILALSPSLVHVFWKSNENLSAADLQGVFTPASYKEGFVGMLDGFPGMTCGIWQHRPDSTGHVRLRSPDPFADPIIQPNYLTDEGDRRALLGGMRLARRLLQTAPLQPWLEGETLPGPAAQSDDELLDFARRYGSTCYHLIGTARMGPASDPSTVVDDELRVHGTDGLRVVDASIMPNMPSANTYASTLMIGEKASDMIRGRPAPAPAEMLAA